MVQFGDKLLMVPLSFISSQDIVEKQLSTVARCKPLMRARYTPHRPAELANAPSLHHCDDSNGGEHRGPLASRGYNLGRDGASARILGFGA